MKKELLIIISLALLAGLLAGCTPNVPPEGSSAYKETPAPGTEVPAAKETGAPDTAEIQGTDASDVPELLLNVPETGKLSDMTEEEIFTYLSEHGVEYSDHIRENFNISAYIKDIEEAPYRPVLFDHPDYHFFCESVQQAVLEYYGLPLRLSDMDRDKLIEKLEELGVDLSDPEIAGYSELNELVASFELDPERDVVSEQPKLNVLFEQVREAVKLYYGELLPLD